MSDDCMVCDHHDDHVHVEHHVVASWRRATELIEVIHHQHGFTVRVIGGKLAGGAVNCTSEASAIIIFNHLVEARKADRRVEWMENSEMEEVS